MALSAFLEIDMPGVAAMRFANRPAQAIFRLKHSYEVNMIRHETV